jgi:hypothetical protein
MAAERRRRQHLQAQRQPALPPLAVGLRAAAPAAAPACTAGCTDGSCVLLLAAGLSV